MTPEFLKLAELVSNLDEIARRTTHPFSTHKALPKQELFHRSVKHTRVNTGGNRSGKSRASAQEIMWWATEAHPYQETTKRPRIWVISPEYRTLYEGIWLHLKYNLPDWEILKFGPKVPGWDLPTFIEFKKGGRIDFISAEGGEDRTKLQAAAIDLVVIDEEVSYDLMTEIEARGLDRDGRIIVGATLVRSEEWIIRLIENAEAGDPDIDHFQFDTRDNPYISEKATKRFIAKLPDDEYEVRILGHSRRTKGLIYSHYADRLAPLGHLVEPFPIPGNWTKLMCLDGGYRIAAALWVAISPPPSKMFAYREMYLPYSEAADWVEFIYQSEGWKLDWSINPHFGWVPGDNYEEIRLRLVDPSDFSHQKDGSVGPATRLGEDYNLDLCPATNDKGQNILDVRSLLQPVSSPKLLVFNTLTNLRSEIKKYRIKPTKDGGKKDLDQPADRPIKKHDHLMNCLEYIASQREEFHPHQTPEEQLEEEAMKDDSEIDWKEGEAGRTQYYAIMRARSRIGRERMEIER